MDQNVDRRLEEQVVARTKANVTPSNETGHLGVARGASDTPLPAVPLPPTPTAAPVPAPEKSPSSVAPPDPDASIRIPRWLRITAVAVPLIATAIAGLWTVATFYRTTQLEFLEATIKRAEREAATAKSQLETSREETRRQEDNRRYAMEAREASQRFQMLMATETLRQRKEEAARAASDALVAQRNENAATQAVEVQKARDESARQVARAERMTALTQQIDALASSQGSTEAPLLKLGTFVNEPDTRDDVLRALETRCAKPLTTPGEVVAATQLAARLLPESLDLLLRLHWA